MQAALPSGRLAVVFGGSGFIGRHVVRALVRRGWRVRVAVRRPDLAGHLQPLGFVGQIHAVQANVRFPASVMRAAEGADAAVNLVGIQTERKRQKFAAVNAGGAAAVAEAARHAGAATFVQLSAIGADEDSPSGYFASRAAGEAAARGAFPDTVVMRPSVVFGPEDTFFNRMAGIARLLPVLPLIGAETRFQPVYVGDVAEAIAEAAEGRAAAGATYELGGPEAMSFRETMRLMLAEIERKRPIVNLPFPLARIAGGVLQVLPGRLITTEEVRQLRVDTLVSDLAIDEGRTLAGLGVAPRSLATVLPSYLSRYRARGEFGRQRG